jgi:hypothetical protein
MAELLKAVNTSNNRLAYALRERHFLHLISLFSSLVGMGLLQVIFAVSVVLETPGRIIGGYTDLPIRSVFQ